MVTGAIGAVRQVLVAVLCLVRAGCSHAVVGAVYGLLGVATGAVGLLGARTDSGAGQFAFCAWVAAGMGHWRLVRLREKRANGRSGE